jgi:ferredoxin
MSTEIYYFSGTGNSLHVAKELQKRLPEANLIPIVSLKDKDVIKTNGDTVGFIFPIHFMTVPVIVKNIIKKLDLKSAKYIFAIATRYGTPCSVMITKIEKVLKKKGKNLDSYLVLNMASNDPKFEDWHPATNEQLTRFESEIHYRLNSFQEIIINKTKYHEKDSHITSPVKPIMEHLAVEISGDGREDFYSDLKCSGCGTCEKVCLSQKIKMIDEKPVWQKNRKCFSCYACINYCPEQSIQIKSNPLIKFYTDKNERYSHPYATVNDIAGQK